MDRIDFRSDTVTWPTTAMRKAMANAAVGDDVYGEDPTVRQLEELAATKTGKEAGVLVSSGTMGNLVGVMAHVDRGEGVILGLDSHIFRSEAGGISALAAAVPQPLATDSQGRMNLKEIEQSISPDDPHYPPSRLIVVENTYGARNGYPIDVGYFSSVQMIAAQHGLSVHLDGARLFNAATALGIGADVIARHIDSVTFCLSKGLCAPVGSVICGSADFADRARRARKILGGGMRQAGIIAAAGIVALKEMIERIAEDHSNARTLAEGLANIPGIIIEPLAVKTNIVFFQLEDEIEQSAHEIVAQLFAEDSILLEANGTRTFRAVTHYWVGTKEVEKLLLGLQRILTERRGL